jgi:hypothetical protein
LARIRLALTRTRVTSVKHVRSSLENVTERSNAAIEERLKVATR